MEINKITSEILDCLRNRGHDDKAIRNMSSDKAFDEYCRWIGIIGYGPSLIYALDVLRESEQDE